MRKAVFFDMPLALLAIGSVLDPDKYEVVIIDGRLEENPMALINKYLDRALCFGVTALTGKPVKDALESTNKVKAIRN